MQAASELIQLAFAGGFLVAAVGAGYWGGQVSRGIKQLQAVTQDHEERLRTGGL